MNVVGKVGSLISQGVYSVATPFHPFGGAVDIIVVEQQDGTYRSTPWYVRFGKFQGVFKGAEKIVRISVNGIETNFHMFLDNSGEAYFVREVESGGGEEEEDVESCVDIHNDHNNHLAISDLQEAVSSNIYGSGNNDNAESNGETDNGAFCIESHSLEDASIEASEFASYHYGSLDEVEEVVESCPDSNSEMVLVSVDGLVLTAPISTSEENAENLQLSTPQFHLGPGESSQEEFVSEGDGWAGGGVLVHDPEFSSPNIRNCNATSPGIPDGWQDPSTSHDVDESVADITVSCITEKVAPGLCKNDTFVSCLEFSELIDNSEDSNTQDVGSVNVIDTRNDFEEMDENKHKVISSMSEVNMEEDKNEVVISSMTKSEHKHVFSNSKCDDMLLGSLSQPHVDAQLIDGSPIGEIESGSSVKSPDLYSGNNVDSISVTFDSPKSNIEQEDELIESGQSRISTEEKFQLEISESQSRNNISALGFEVSLCGNLLRPGVGSSFAAETFEAHRVSKEEFEKSGHQIVKNEKLVLRFKGRYFSWDKAAPIVLGMAAFGGDLSIELKDPIPIEEGISNSLEYTAIYSSQSNRGWRLWPIPFRRVKSSQHASSNTSIVEPFVDSEISQNPQKEPSVPCYDNQSPRKQFFRTNIPTTEQIASLNLKDGQNMVAFIFCTRVLGKQQVDAHIYLWKWNARIVISDVDGTITRSDVLGQFMPLVGKDWTQSGVARLFSAIKENGYQLLFLSARAIVQAYLTRSFLRNLKQDGKALPNGPIVISPDGLFPSLYREVIRRAPHEFKIACLEDIKALFPSDYNPFYAGFGNRDTDEFSYRKIGIPKGKIFIINPKGEVAVNHRIDVKSYTCLHTLVNDMFPPTSLVEQEDYNSWNYWKIPLPSIDC